ncbi:CinA family protein [Gordonia rubripertincta]|uniref:CinA family protein n=2 Tax=Gordonia rubripertincta TaxID=36822 RepID=A0AAW6RBC7_GORRU|nr:CinA family protein [Gordonia rubripertincta]ASR03414.1 Nicotinamide-nucleotide amidohydrolase PncC [Gordonia rubripertincta]MBM7278909.1 CinA family protein [Gordonia rubripertincta]MDG6781483.1 CinA family protein [Gordonia rubripertincta]NKY61355.1 CinA family protein [Gordonia rubripertincta]NKY61744.1 CinA family protein [Gordonia rubripertincta]
MSDVTDFSETCARLADAIVEQGVHVAVAESLTGGNLASELSKAPQAGDWFRGGVIAYHEDVKFGLLEVPEGPVVSETAARAMVATTARLFDAEIVVAVTGEAGPEPDEAAPGTVWFGLDHRGKVSASRKEFDGEPEDVLAQTIAYSLELIESCLR